MSVYQLSNPFYGDGSNRKLPVDLLISYIFVGTALIDTDEDLDHLVTGGTLLSLTPAQVTATGLTPTVFTPIADRADATGAGAYVEVAEDVITPILYRTSAMVLLSSASGAKVITTGSSNPGQAIDIRLQAAAGGSYTLVVDSGTLTFNAAAEYARIVRNDADDAWIVLALIGATIV